MGTPIGLIFLKAYRGRHRIAKVTVVAPANLYAEGFVEMGERIGGKVLNDLRSPEGRHYWSNSLFEYFINPFRSLEEGYEVSEEPVAGPLMRELQRQGITLLVAISPDDDVFPRRLVETALTKLGIAYVVLTRGGKHSPDFHPKQLNADLRRHGAL